MLKVKKLDPRAKLPEVAHAGEDLGYDLFALEDTVLKFGVVTKVRTGIAAQAMFVSYLRQVMSREPDETIPPDITLYGLLIRDRSSMASKGIVVSGGVIDHGYTGEISVLMTCTSDLPRYDVWDFDPTNSKNYIRSERGYEIKAGDKISQMIPLPILTGEVVEVEELGESRRGADGFGSTGQ